MKKNKEGKVIASLTEVKNKTGDIFALADEFGEVLLTSYNKPRYKIVKIDISEVLDLGEDDSPVEPVKVKAKPEKPIKAENRVEEALEPKENIESESAMNDEKIDFTPWDRNNSNETSFVKNATKALIN